MPGSSYSSDHWHVHFQRTLPGWRQTPSEGYSQQRLQKQVSRGYKADAASSYSLLGLRIKNTSSDCEPCGWIACGLKMRARKGKNFWATLMQIDQMIHCSLEVGVRAEAYQAEGPNRHINSAFMIFEVLDDSGKPCTLPRIRPEVLVSTLYRTLTL